MMKTKTTLISLMVSAALVGCSSGTGSAPGSTIGVVTGFGSVYVNGVKYETGSSSFDIDGQSGAESDLAVGQVVTLNGSVNADGVTGTATNISFADNVEGVVISTALDVNGVGTMNVMGQNVTVTDTTRFESEVVSIADMASISAGNLLEVSGYSQGDGNIIATHIEVKAASFSGQEMEVKGLVANLATGAQSFNIGSLVVEYGSATMDLEGKTLANGLYVEAKTVSALSGSTMTASKVEIEGDGDMDIDVAEGEEIKIRGPITEVGADYIIVNGQTIYFDANTEGEDGVDLGSLSVGMSLEVEAYMSADGRLVAMELENEQEDAYEIRAHLQAVNPANNTITVLGQSIQVNNATMMVDDRDEGYTPVRRFSLADLTAGQWIEVKFYRDQAQNLLATKLERDDDTATAGEFKLEGLVESVSASSFSIGGIAVDLGKYPGAAIGQELEVKGSYVNGVFTISSVTLDL